MKVKIITEEASISNQNTRIWFPFLSVNKNTALTDYIVTFLSLIFLSVYMIIIILPPIKSNWEDQKFPVKGFANCNLTQLACITAKHK